MVEALAGGAIGTVLVFVAWLIARGWAIPNDVRAHDERARILNEDLELWVGDEHEALKATLESITVEMSVGGLLASSTHAGARAAAKSATLHRYRDRLHESQRAISELAGRESWLHRIWRRVRHIPPLRLDAADRVEPVLNEWRTSAEVTGGISAPVRDPTRWRLDDLLVELRDS